MLDRIHQAVAVREVGTRKVYKFASIDKANAQFCWTQYGSSPLKRIRKALKAGDTVRVEFDGKTFEFSPAQL